MVTTICPMQGGQRFFFDFQGEEGYLPPKEAIHAIRVLRKREGALIKLIDGRGKEYLGLIYHISGKRNFPTVKIKILEILREEQQPPFQIGVLIPFLKANKTEFLIEKATELGMSTLLLYQSTHTISVKENFNEERYQEKAISALKQSGRLYLPKITFVNNLSKYLRNLPEEKSLRLLAHPQGEMALEEMLELIKNPPSQILLLSGPEGDLSPEELSLARTKGFRSISLSPYVLRAETASLALMCLISSLLLPFYKLYK